MTERLMPARSQASSHVILDLDEIHSKKSAVHFQGKDFLLVPITMELAMEIDRARVNLLAFDPSGAIDMKKVYEEQYQFIKLVIPSLTLDHLFQMTVHQVHRVLKAVNEHIQLEISGKLHSHIEEEKKKNLLNSG